MGTIVCAVDDSPEAEEALRVAVRLSDDTGLRLVVAHVEERAHAGSDHRPAEHRGRQLLDRLLARQGLNGSADTRVEVGERANELARMAAEEAASVIVVGSRGHRWWWRQRTGSLTDDLAATAACPVVVVPPAPRR
jgi:nucleotide-binding universal stress UspA family protein